ATTYTITLTNNGPSTVPAGVVVKDTIPANTTGSTTDGRCVIAGSVVTCTTTAALTPSGSTTFNLTLAVAADYPGTSLTNTATIDSSPVTDPTPGNNSGSDTDTVTTSANLSITKTDGETAVTAGDGATHTYTITVSNAGPSNASGVSISDSWAAGFSQGTITPSQGTCTTGPNFTCALGTVASGSNATVTVSYTVPAGTTGDQTNTVTVSSGTTDPVTTNDTASDTDTVTTSADLSI